MNLLSLFGLCYHRRFCLTAFGANMLFEVVIFYITTFFMPKKFFPPVVFVVDGAEVMNQDIYESGKISRFFLKNV